MKVSSSLLLLLRLLLLLHASPLPFPRTLSPSALPHLLAHCSSISHPGFQALCQLHAALDAEGTSPAARKPASTPLHDPQSASNLSSLYKDQDGASLHRYALHRSHHLEETLQRYASMHRRCVSLDYKSLMNESKGGDSVCRYVVWSCSFGLGNRIMSLVSTFLYAVLSQRVLLVDNPGWDDLFSQPFQGSNWLAPAGFSFQQDYKSPSFHEYLDLRCGKRGNNPTKCRTKVVSIEFRMDTKATALKFLACPSAMAKVTRIPFLNFRNINQYFAVGYYLNPAIRPLLEFLFPDRNPFHMLSRFLLNPSDNVWKEVTRLHRSYLEGAVQRVGVQLRESKGQYTKYFDTAVPLCLKRRPGMCPASQIDGDERDGSPPAFEIENATDYVSVFVSSLAGGHFHKLKASMGLLRSEIKQKYVLFCQESDGEQLDDIGHQQKALVDMWVLSLSDVLLTSPMSTFGYTAQGLAGLTPLHLKPWKKDPCWLTVSSDPCFHFAPSQVECPADGLHIRNPATEFDFLSRCPDLPNTGLQLKPS